MARERFTFEGPSAYMDAATLAARIPGAEVEHEGVLYTVAYDPANAPTPVPAGYPSPVGYPAPGYPAPGYPGGYPVSVAHPTSAGFPLPGTAVPNVASNSVAAAIEAARARKA